MKTLIEKIDLFTEKKETEYQKFFRETLKKYGVNEPDELSKEEKKKFFDEIDVGWKSKKEKKGVDEGKTYGKTKDGVTETTPEISKKDKLIFSEDIDDDTKLVVYQSKDTKDYGEFIAAIEINGKFYNEMWKSNKKEAIDSAKKMKKHISYIKKRENISEATMKYVFKSIEDKKKVADYLNNKEIDFEEKDKQIIVDERDLDKSAMKFIQKVKMNK